MVAATGRRPKGDRDVFAPSLRAPVAEVVTARAAQLGLNLSDYLSAVLAETVSMPWTSPPDVRVAGGLAALGAREGIDPLILPEDSGDDRRVRVYVRPARAVGDVVRQRCKTAGQLLNRYVSDLVEDYHRNAASSLGGVNRVSA